MGEVVARVTRSLPGLDAEQLIDLIQLAAAISDAAQSHTKLGQLEPEDRARGPRVPEAAPQRVPNELPITGYNPTPRDHRNPESSIDVEQTGADSPFAESDEGKSEPVSTRQLALDATADGPVMLHLERALRPFKRPWRSGRRLRIHLDKTIQEYGQTGWLTPIMVPADERWFDVRLLVDSSFSMQPWVVEISRFVELFRGAGHFREVQRSELAVFPESCEVRDSHAGVIRPASLSSPFGRTLVIILSDFADEGWAGRAPWQLVRTLADSTPTVLINVLPVRLWRLSALEFPSTYAVATRPGARNAELIHLGPAGQAKPPRGRSDRWSSALAPPMVIPLVAFSGRSVGRWASMLMQSDSRSCSALLLPDPEQLPRRGELRTLLEGADLANAFLITASAKAARLAVLCSSLPEISIQVLNVIRVGLLLDTTAAHVSELLVSGIFAVATSDTGAVSLTFRDGVQDELNRRLTITDALRVYELLIEHARTVAGDRQSSVATVYDVTTIGQPPTEAQTFVMASRNLLNLLGWPGATTDASVAPVVRLERSRTVASSHDKAAGIDAWETSLPPIDDQPGPDPSTLTSRGSLLMIATAHYNDPDVWGDLEGVKNATRVWTDWLTDPALGDRAFTVKFDDLARSPSKTRVDAVLREREGFDRYRDVLVCYIAGHVEQHNREFRLVLSTSRPNEPSSMLPTRQVLDWAIDRFATGLVVIDACDVGDIATFLSSLDMDLPAGWVVIVAASARKTARLGELTEAMRAFAETGADQDAQPYLDYWDLIPALAEALEDQNWQLFGTPPPRSRSRLLTLPNRHYRPDVDERVPVASARQDVAMYASDLVAHWDPRSRGVGDASTPGMLFTGRDRLMRTLISAAQGEPGSLVVTGVAGCGKSAVLSRLVTFSDPGFRARHAEAVDAADAAGEPLPRVGDVDVAVLAKGFVAQTVLDAIRDRLGIPSVDGEPIGDTITRIHRARDGHRRITLVVDALDEAEDPRGIVTSVLSPLVTPPGAAWLRLLIGVRGSAPTAADPNPVEDGLAAAIVRVLSATVVDAAAPPYWTEADLARYVSRLLRTPFDGEQLTPYATAAADQVDPLASAVAKIASTSYVLARLISDQLRRQSHPQDPTDPAWQARSRAGLAQILTAELEQDYPDPDRRRVARCLLTAAALARGRGAPRRKIWPVLAQALDPTGRRYTDTDIAALLDEHIGGYLIRDAAENATVYRPFYDSLAGALTSALDQNARRRVTTGLLALFTVTRSHGLVVPPEEYLRRHAVEHAADSGDLDWVIHRPDVLTWTDPDHVIPLLGTLQDPDAQAIGRIYRTVADTLRQPDRPPDTSVLQLRVRQAGLNKLADGLADAAPDPAALQRWSTPRRDSDHHRIDTP